MSLVPLRLGPLTVEGLEVQRSGIRWLREEGHVCAPGEVIAYCNIGLAARSGTQLRGDLLFHQEARDFQVGLATASGGRLKKSSGTSHGGFLDLLCEFGPWDPDFTIGHIEKSGSSSASADESAEELRLLFLIGRRTTQLAENRSGILTGWHDRVRAWWGGGTGSPGTVLSYGICEQLGIIRGESFAFLEMFRAVRGPAHVVFVSDDALVPCARVATEQLQRTEAQYGAIAEDFARTFFSSGIIPAGKGWIFMGALLSALETTHLGARYDILTRTGLSRGVGADAVILSLNAETTTYWRHRRLGYSLNCHRYRLTETGPAVRAWFEQNFEPVRRTPDDVRRDYRDLIDAARAKSPMKFLIMNVMSTSGREDINNYAAFDQPLGNTLASIHAKDLNLMLYDLARERDIEIVDADAIAAEIGAGAHLPDGVHGSGPMQDEVRAEILRILRKLRIPGFDGPPVS